MTPPLVGRRRILLVRAIVIVLVVTLAAVEVEIRLLVGLPRPERLPLARVIPHPELGWTMMPGDLHYTYDIPVQLNALGYRGPAVSAKAATEYRIVALGDSHVYGQGVADADLATALIERHYRQPPASCDVRVINLGVRAYSINQEYAVLRRLGPALAPDLVLLFFYLNDFELVDVHRRWERFKHLDWYTFDLGAKPAGDVMRWWTIRQIARTSALINWAHDAWFAWTARDDFEEAALRGHLDQRMIDDVHEYLVRFVALADELNTRFTVVVVPHAAQIRREFPQNRYQRTITEMAGRLRTSVIDPLPVFRRDYAELKRWPVIPFDGHYDAAGQRLLATGVLEHLATEWPEPRCPARRRGA